MKKFKNLKLSLGFLVVVASSNSFATGIPVVDGAHIATDLQNQIKSWALEAERWTIKISQFEDEYKAKLDHIATQTGARDIKHFMDKSKDILGKVKNLEKWIENPDQFYKYGKDMLANDLKAVFSSYHLENLCVQQDEKERKACEGGIILDTVKQVQAEKGIEQVKERIETINDIADRMGRAKDTKEAQDLSNAMQTQIALLNADKIKIELENNIDLQQQRILQKQKKAQFKEKLRKGIRLENAWED
ncbi:type IV secretion system protein [Pasteurella atlantica]|uniref:type IV secretion system protein n=1 Tax=Phocoenobacter atlanticus TaxID=3416742 RepID=UPI0027737201|nr:type IV secretion system protein [Pasteurella atlantica]MDP8042536.1 type IV secretion system protein [Pasteurella atlantica]